MIGCYGSPKNNGRRFLLNRQRRARPKRRGRMLIPIFALSAAAVISRLPVVVLPEPSPVRDHTLRITSKPKQRSCQAFYENISNHMIIFMLCCTRQGHGVIRKQRKRFKIPLTHKAAQHIPLRTLEKRVLVNMLGGPGAGERGGFIRREDDRYRHVSDGS
jgi:hypothetical protein